MQGGHRIPRQMGWRINAARLSRCCSLKCLFAAVRVRVCSWLCGQSPPQPALAGGRSWQYHMQRLEATHVADLILSLFDSLQLWGVSHHAEAFPLVLLKLLLVANLGTNKEKKKKDLNMGESWCAQQLDSATDPHRDPRAL